MTSKRIFITGGASGLGKALALRFARVLRHRLGRDDDELVFAEDDPGWFVGLERTVSGAFAVIRVSATM